MKDGKVDRPSIDEIRLSIGMSIREKWDERLKGMTTLAEVPSYLPLNCDMGILFDTGLWWRPVRLLDACNVQGEIIAAGTIGFIGHGLSEEPDVDLQQEAPVAMLGGGDDVTIPWRLLKLVDLDEIGDSIEQPQLKKWPWWLKGPLELGVALLFTFFSVALLILPDMSAGEEPKIWFWCYLPAALVLGLNWRLSYIFLLLNMSLLSQVEARNWVEWPLWAVPMNAAILTLGFFLLAAFVRLGLRGLKTPIGRTFVRGKDGGQ